MDVPLWLIGLVDPVSREFERESRQFHLRRGRGHRFRVRSRAPRAAVVHGPGVSGGSRPATPEEVAAGRARHDAHRRERDRVRADVLTRYADELAAGARDLLATGAATLPFPTMTLEARLRRFWRGDRLLSIRAVPVEPGGPHGSSLSRYPRHDRPGEVDRLVDDLALSLSSQLASS